MDWQQHTERETQASLLLLQGLLAKCSPAKSFTLFPPLSVFLPHFFLLLLLSFQLTPSPTQNSNLRQFVFFPSSPFLCLSAAIMRSLSRFPIPHSSFATTVFQCVRVCESKACLSCHSRVARHRGILNAAASLSFRQSFLSLSLASKESECLCPSAPEEIMRCQRRERAFDAEKAQLKRARDVRQRRRPLGVVRGVGQVKLGCWWHVAIKHRGRRKYMWVCAYQ